MTFLRGIITRFFKVGFAIATLLLAVVFYFAYQKIQVLSAASDWVMHAQVVRLELTQISGQMHETAAIQRRFLLTKDSAFLIGLNQREAGLSSSFYLLDSLIEDSSIQQRNLDSLRHLVQYHLLLLQKTNSPDMLNQTSLWIENRAVMDSIQAQAKHMDRVEAGLLAQHQRSRDKSLHMAPVFALLLLLLALAILVFSYIRIRNDLRHSRQQLQTDLENTKKIVQLNQTLRHAEQIAQTGNWQMNLRTGERQYSENVYRLIGFEPDSFEPALDNWLLLVHPDDQHRVLGLVEFVLSKKTDPPGIIFRLTRPDGQLRYFHAEAKVVEDLVGEQTLIGTIHDITESQLLRQELEMRVQFTEALLDNLTDTVSAFDRNLNVLTLNKAGEEFFQINRADIIGRNILKIYPHLRTNPALLDQFQRAIQGETIHFSTHSILLRNRMLEIFFIPLLHPDQPGGSNVLTIVRDTTEAYQLRKELEERTRFAELVVESSVDMIAAYDKELRYTVWNQRCVEILGLQKEEVLGKYVFEVFPDMKGQDISESLFQALAGQPAYFPPQYSLISEHYFENYVLPLQAATDEVSGVLTITHNVTESYRLRQELEERSRFAETIIESSVDIIVTYDTDLRITAWNKKSEEIFKLTRQEVLGRHVEDVFPSIANTDRLIKLQSVLQGETVYYEPHELSPYGIHANLFLLPLIDHAGRVTGVLSITHDVTDVVESAAQLAALNQALEEKNRELANNNAELASFSYVASHDLQEPLRKIQAFGSRILTTEHERLTPTGQDAFRRMLVATDRMQQLIEDLLTYSRTNTEPGEFAVVNLDTVLQEAELEVSEAINETKALIEAEPLPLARVLAFQFRQLLANLLSNALKYQRPEVIPHIQINCAVISGQELHQIGATAERYFCISVQDNGIGFDQQYAERIFELFQRLHGRSEYKGTGIGLAICRKIMQNHHGFLLAEGRPGEGSTFRIYLPA